jgi:hypothetical protein
MGLIVKIKNIWNKLTITNAPSGAAIDPKKAIIKRVGLVFSKGSGAQAKTAFQEPEFDLEEITKAYNTDSYIRQAIDKYIDLIFKAGWDIVGKNQNSVDYIKVRLAVMSDATQTPLRQFLLEIAEDLVKYGNAFIIKARASGQYTLPAGVTATPVSGKKVVAGYFVMPPTTITIARDEVGTVVNYQQNISGKTPVEYKPEDIIHIHWKRERGMAFGYPFLIPVLDDVKVLRSVEENVIRLIYRHLFPLYLYKVGLPEPGLEATDPEIEEVRDQIRNMPLDGGLVVPERHDVKVVGTEGQALDASDYLEYFRKRVFTGLGVSETIMGISDSSNRSTAESMTTEMHDRIKAFQRVIAEGLVFHIFNELLREGGFDPLTRPDDKVEFQFKEIDLDMRTKLENMVGQLWNNNMITFEEARQELGKDSVVDESRLFANMIGTIEAEKQKDTDSNKASTTSSTTTKTVASNKKVPLAESINTLKVNQYREGLEYHWGLARSDVIELIKRYYISQNKDLGSFEPKEIQGIIHLANESMQRTAESYIRSAFISGTESAMRQANKYSVPNVNYEAGIRELVEFHNSAIKRLLEEDLNYSITIAIRSAQQENAISKVMGAFQALSFRLGFISSSELYRAFNFGFIKCALAMGYSEVAIKSDYGCEECIVASANKVSTHNVTAGSSSIPPFHPNCTCLLYIDKEV